MKPQGEHFQHEKSVKFYKYCELNTITCITANLWPLPLGVYRKFGWRRENEKESEYIEELGKTPSSTALAFDQKILCLYCNCTWKKTCSLCHCGRTSSHLPQKAHQLCPSAGAQWWDNPGPDRCLTVGSFLAVRGRDPQLRINIFSLRVRCRQINQESLTERHCFLQLWKPHKIITETEASYPFPGNVEVFPHEVWMHIHG